MKIFRFFATVVAFAVLSAVASAGDDAFFGTWVLKQNKSDFELFTAQDNLKITGPIAFTQEFRTEDKETNFGDADQKPLKMTITIERDRPDNQRIYYKSETEYTGNKKSVSEYTNDYSGVPVVVLTDGLINSPVSLERKGDRDVVATYYHGQNVFATSERTISDDGKTMTIVTTSPDASGKMVSSRLIFEKQQ